jgi:hypothetical protein
MKAARDYLVVIIFLSCLIFMGCAVTKVTSFKDPETAPGKTYSKIAVVAPLDDLENRADLERTLASWFRQSGSSATPLIDIFPPTRKPDNDEIAKRLTADGFDGLLLVRLTAAYSDESTSPGFSNTIWGRSGAITSYTPATTHHKPRVKFRFELIDLPSRKTVWVSSSFTRGNAYAGTSTLFNSLAQSTIEKLKDDRMIKASVELGQPKAETK